MNAQPQAAMTLIIASINAWLTITQAGYRVTADGIIITRRGGVTFIALRETRDAADWRRCAPPYSTMSAD